MYRWAWISPAYYRQVMGNSFIPLGQKKTVDARSKKKYMSGSNLPVSIAASWRLPYWISHNALHIRALFPHTSDTWCIVEYHSVWSCHANSASLQDTTSVGPGPCPVCERCPLSFSTISTSTWPEMFRITRCSFGPMGHFTVEASKAGHVIPYSKMAHGAEKTPGDSA